MESVVGYIVYGKVTSETSAIICGFFTLYSRTLDTIPEMVRRTRISPEVKAYARFLRTDARKSVRAIAQMCDISPASVVRILRQASCCYNR